MQVDVWFEVIEAGEQLAVTAVTVGSGWGFPLLLEPPPQPAKIPSAPVTVVRTIILFAFRRTDIKETISFVTNLSSIDLFRVEHRLVL